jgi:hypothetical protein
LPSLRDHPPKKGGSRASAALEAPIAVAMIVAVAKDVRTMRSSFPTLAPLAQPHIGIVVNRRATARGCPRRAPTRLLFVGRGRLRECLTRQIIPSTKAARCGKHGARPRFPCRIQHALRPAERGERNDAHDQGARHCVGEASSRLDARLNVGRLAGMRTFHHRIDDGKGAPRIRPEFRVADEVRAGKPHVCLIGPQAQAFSPPALR